MKPNNIAEDRGIFAPSLPRRFISVSSMQKRGDNVNFPGGGGCEASGPNFPNTLVGGVNATGLPILPFLLQENLECVEVNTFQSSRKLTASDEEWLLLHDQSAHFLKLPPHISERK